MPSKPLFRKAAIVGVGQIGGSFAWAVKKRGLAGEVVGIAKKSQAHAEKMGMIDRGYAADQFKKALHGADLVVLALPVSLNEAFIRDRVKTGLIDPGATVIDVGSTKSAICTLAQKSILKNRFVGCHPMAGSEKSGPAHANPDLFEDALCFLARSHAPTERLWRAVGARPVILDARAHDAWVAYASHLPHLLAFLLFVDFPQPLKGKGRQLRANPSIRDLARIAKSSPQLWSEIFASNRAELLAASGALETRLKQFNQALRKRNSRTVERLLGESNRRSEAAFPAHEN